MRCDIKRFKNMSDLKNKNIIITGASGGIGNSIVKKLNEVWCKHISFRN